MSLPILSQFDYARHMFGLSVGACVLLVILIVALTTKLGKRILRPLLTFAVILVAIYALWLWRGSWMPVADPIIRGAITMIRSMWTSIMAGPA